MLARYFRTLRHLRPSQWLGQLKVRVCRRNPARLSSAGEIPGRMVSQAVLVGLPSPVPAQPPEDLKAGRFTFLSETRSLGRTPDWDVPEASRLWRYNLHYFDWLWSLLPTAAPDWETARDLTLKWIANHPPTRHACGWEPYPTSLRVLNWSLLFGIRHRERTAADPAFRDALLVSLQRQVEWLEGNLETHIQANHLLENLAALVCAHSSFAWNDSPHPPPHILRHLRHELDEQILGDGMHYERSPMYHLRMLWIIEAMRMAGPAQWHQPLADLSRKMKRALSLLRHPDGGIPLLNDSALGIYADGWTHELTDDGPWALPEAGYYGARAGGDFVVIDAGPIGPDHQPGHAHADFFSFELSLGGQRVMTDTGVATYDRGAVRDYDRSTAAHNTVEVDGDNSVEVWGAFRVGRRTRPKINTWQPTAEHFVLDAEHEGYLHLPARAVHQRRFAWQPGCFEISDELRVRQTSEAVARIHFAPGVELRVDGMTAHGRVGDAGFHIETTGADSLSLEQSMYHPTFNQAVPRSVLCLRLRAHPPKQAWTIRVRWDHTCRS